MSRKIFGIDLGTTYSCISHVDEYGRPEILRNIDAESTTPSVVLFDSAEHYTVGQQAKRQSRISPDSVVSLVKRHMGDAAWSFSTHGTEWSAAQVSSLILRALADDAARATGEEVNDVVITVPAYFGDEERRATRQAGEYAGLNVVDIINEPTAAAFAYGFGQSDSLNENILVYDLGGGTFDTAVIQLSEKKITVVATEGDHELGGSDWDNRLATHLAARFLREEPGADDPLDDSHGTQDLLTSAEEAKKALTSREAADVLVVHGDRRANLAITRDEFESATESLLERTIELTRSTIAAARESGVESLDRVLLVGGSSKMPAVSRRLAEEFGFQPLLQDPDLAVAKGAAIYGQKMELERFVFEDLIARGVLKSGQRLSEAASAELEKSASSAGEEYGMSSESVAGIVTREVQNTCTRGFGVIVHDAVRDEEYACFLVHRNDALPKQIERRFSTRTDNQQEVRIQVFEQGGGDESEKPEDNNVIVEGMITGIPFGQPRGTPVDIVLTMAGNGLLEVTARHAALDRPLLLKIDVGTVKDAAAVAAEVQALATLKQRV